MGAVPPRRHRDWRLHDHRRYRVDRRPAGPMAAAVGGPGARDRAVRSAAGCGIRGNGATVLSPVNSARRTTWCASCPVMNPELGFCVHVRPEQVRAVELEAGPDTIRGTLQMLDPELPSPVSVLASSAMGQYAGDVVQTTHPARLELRTERCRLQTKPLSGSSGSSTGGGKGCGCPGPSTPVTVAGSAADRARAGIVPPAATVASRQAGERSKRSPSR